MTTITPTKPKAPVKQEPPKRVAPPKRKRTKKAAIVALAVIALAACGTNTHEERKNIGGIESICSWSERGFNPFGQKDDYICQGIIVGQNGVTVPLPPVTTTP